MWGSSANTCRTKAPPMKPAPPVIRTTGGESSRSDVNMAFQPLLGGLLPDSQRHAAATPNSLERTQDGPPQAIQMGSWGALGLKRFERSGGGRCRRCGPGGLLMEQFQLAD